MLKRCSLVAALVLLLSPVPWAQEAQVDVAPALHATKHGKPPKPTKAIHWLVNLDRGMKESAKTGRPLIAYFTYDT